MCYSHERKGGWYISKLVSNYLPLCDNHYSQALSAEAGPFMIGIDDAIQRKANSYVEAISQWNRNVKEPNAITIVRD